MDVLRFECSEYRLTISTADVSYAWERFERRVKDEAMSYCDYKSSCEGTLSLLNPRELSRGLQKLNREVPQTEWREKHPVLFETCEYQFAVEFKQLHNTSDEKHRPKVRHKLKTVGENFKFYPNGKNTGIRFHLSERKIFSSTRS